MDRTEGCLRNGRTRVGACSQDMTRVVAMDGKGCKERVNTTDRVKTSEDNRKERNDSFDRFGDDLLELIVSYLTIEDKFRFQCLSKQWRRVVFNKTYVLKI